MNHREIYQTTIWVVINPQKQKVGTDLGLYLYVGLIID